MKTTLVKKTPLPFLMKAGLCGLAFSTLDAAPITWDANTSGNWSTSANWLPNSAAPKAGDAAIIGNATSNRTITYDGSASGALAALSFTQTTAGVLNLLDIAKAGSSSAPSLVIADDVVLGSAGGTVALRLNGTSNAVYLQIGATGNGTVTVNSGGELDLYGGLTTGTTGGPTLAGNVAIAGGKLDLGAGASSGAIYPVITGNLSMSSGTMVVNNTANKDIRTRVFGNFTVTGGTITQGAGVSDSSGQFLLYGENNAITAANSIASGIAFYLVGGDGKGGILNQNFSTAVSIGELSFRGASGVKTISTSGAGTRIESIRMGSELPISGTQTLKLGSDVNATSFVLNPWGGNASGALAIDLAGHNLTFTNAFNLVAGGTGGAGNTWAISNTSAADAMLTASFFTLTGNVVKEIKVGGAGQKLTLKATGTAKSDLGGTGIFDSGVRFLYVGKGSGDITSNRAIGSVEVGDGINSSTLNVVNSDLTMGGNLKVNANSTFNSGGRLLKLTGSASLNGAGGTIKGINSTGGIQWVAGATGGISLGNGVGDIGRLKLDMTGNVSGTPSLTLASTSVSVFDIASLSSFDTLDLGGFGINYSSSTLNLNFMGDYMPGVGDKFQIFENTGSFVGNFGDILSNLAGYGFTYTASTGELEVTAIPEPQTATFLFFASVTGAAWLAKQRRTVSRS